MSITSFLLYVESRLKVVKKEGKLWTLGDKWVGGEMNKNGILYPLTFTFMILKTIRFYIKNKNPISSCLHHIVMD